MSKYSLQIWKYQCPLVHYKCYRYCSTKFELHAETVRDSLGADDTALAAPMGDFGKIQDPIPRRRHYSESSTEDVATDFERQVRTDVSDAIESTSPGKTHSAPFSDKCNER